MDGYIVKFERPFTGLKRVANLLVSNEKRGHYPCAFTQGLYKHQSRPITVSLVVDDFGVKYLWKEDVDHLEQTIKNSYPMKRIGLANPISE